MSESGKSASVRTGAATVAALLEERGLPVSGTASPHIWDVSFEVKLGPARPVAMHARIYQSTGAAEPGAVTMVGVHGVAHAGFAWRNLSRSIFESPELQHRVRAFIALDLPGHGDSGLPPAEKLGDLELADYAVAVSASLQALSSHGASIDAVIGHSMGGILLQLVQHDLLAQGTSLREKLGVKSAILYASNMSVELPWAASAPPPQLAQFFDRESKILEFPPPVWQMVFFTNKSGTLVEGAPTVEEIVSGRYGSPESITAFDKVTVNRLSVPAGIFAAANGTKTAVITGDQDFLMTPDEERSLYAYVTGKEPDAPDSCFTAVQDPGAVHDMFINQPDKLIPGLCRVLA